MFKNRRRGLSAVELVVVVAIIGILMALLLPAIQAVREAARISQCKHHLKTITLAFANYELTHAVYPPGIVAVGAPFTREPCEYVAKTGVCDHPNAARTSALTMVLPYFDNVGTYDAYNLNLACCAPQNVTAVSRVIAGYVCPTNPRETDAITWTYYDDTGVRTGSKMAGATPTDYKLNAGASAILHCSPALVAGEPQRAWGNHSYAAGPFNVNSSTRVKDIRDGLSQTLMIGESVGGAQMLAGTTNAPGKPVALGKSGLWAGSKTDAVDTPWSQGYIGGKTGNGGFGSVFAVTAFNAFGDRDGLVSANQWFPIPLNEGRLNYGRVTAYDKSYAGITPVLADGNSDNPNIGVGGFQGYHKTRSVNFAYLDGHVESIALTVDPFVYAAQSTIAGQEKDQ